VDEEVSRVAAEATAAGVGVGELVEGFLGGALGVEACRRRRPQPQVPADQPEGRRNVIELLTFEAQGCEAGFCIFARGEPVHFLVETNAPPDRYLWDWDGNGTVDEVTVQPVTYAYEAFGIYTPRVTVERGSGSDTLVHGQYILAD